MNTLLQQRGIMVVVTRAVLVVPSTTYRADGFFRAAASMGIEVAIASDADLAIGAMRAAGSRAKSGALGVVKVCLEDPEGAADVIERFARSTPLDAVVGVDERAGMVANAAAMRLGLPHNPPGAIAASRDKIAMRAAAARGGINQPELRVVTTVDDAREAARSIGLPCVVKPASLSGSRGVIRVDEERDLPGTLERVRKVLAAAGEDPCSPVLLEKFVPGAEVAVEGILDGGRLLPIAVFDKPDPLDGPYFEETLYVTPSRHEPAVLRRVLDAAEAAALALGLERGPVHAELRIDRGQPFFIELAARSIGGYCSRSVVAEGSWTLEELILSNALGWELPSLPEDSAQLVSGASGVMMIPIARSGVLQSVEGLVSARSVPMVTEVTIAVHSGQPVVALPEGDRYLGFIFARGPSAAEVEGAIRDAYAELDIRIVDVPGPIVE